MGTETNARYSYDYDFYKKVKFIDPLMGTETVICTLFDKIKQFFFVKFIDPLMGTETIIVIVKII